MKTRMFRMTVLLFVPYCLLFTANSFSQSNRLWGTYYGGTGYEFSVYSSITTDGSGNVYLSGRTNSVNAIASGGFQNSYGGGTTDAFLAKFNAAGVLQWATYYGGTGDDAGSSTDVDNFGNVYLSGYTNSVSGIASGGFQNTYGGGSYDAFLVKFNGGGIRLWATYYGGTGGDRSYSMTVDILGNVYMGGGYTTSNNGIASGGFQNTLGGMLDAFLVKFDSAGIRQWATYYGGAGWEETYNVTTDTAGNVYLAGYTNSTGGIAFGGHQNTYGGSPNVTTDAFLVKFDSAGARLWATYYGGTGSDYGWGVAADASGNVYLAGSTNSPNAIASGGFQNTFGGAANDAFLVKFDVNGTRLWATYYGGIGNDVGRGVAIDASGNAYLLGHTSSINAIASGGFQNTFGGGSSDAFLAAFNSSGVRACATYYGGTSTDNGFSTSIDGWGNVYLAGDTDSPNTIPSGGFQNTYGGGLRDVFLVKFCPCSNCNVLNATVTSTNVLCNGQCMGTATATAAGGSPSYTYAWLPGGGSTSSATGLCAGNYTVTVSDGTGSTSTATITITEPPLLIVTTTATNSACGSSNGTASVTAVGGSPSYTYSWNPGGQTNQTSTGLSAGTYTATVADANNCIITQTVTVVSSGSVITTSQTVNICSGTTYTLPGGIIVSTGGTYNDTLTSAGGCDSIITTNLTVNPNPAATVFSIPTMSGQVVTIAQGQSVTLIASGGGTYSWNNGANESSITVTPPITTLYCVTVTDANNCTDTACVTVTIEPMDCSTAGELYLPNAFSPNNDGENDKLLIYYGNMKCIKTFELVIYNRWGEKVFNTNNPSVQWDGSFREKTEGIAVFVYYLEATLINEERVVKKGNVSLIK